MGVTTVRVTGKTPITRSNQAIKINKTAQQQEEDSADRVLQSITDYPDQNRLEERGNRYQLKSLTDAMFIIKILFFLI
ncbi:hypothetical protein BTA35_0205100 [Oceanospirillum linum]|uniref:Uncharacterized protein n=1 Tax=Oceanospirillum linum TaxID=966 RepID=A0A1T1HGB8_OCELI|nr:hypothetical protein BTA35_0205100 [Oceanospirillum linum]